MKKFILTFVTFLLAVGVLADPPLPDATGFINDEAGLLSSSQIDALEVKARNYRDQSGHEIAVLIVETSGDRSIEDLAYDVYQKWGIGSDKTDDGVLFLVAFKDRKARIEVGYGLEGDLTDLECGRLVNKSSPMAEAFRAGDYAGGVNAVFDGIVAGISGEYIPPAPTKRSGKNGTKRSPFVHIILLAALGGSIFISRLKNRNNHWRPGGPRRTGGLFGGGFTVGGGSGFGGGGGFGGFSGGSSGGGGASGGW